MTGRAILRGGAAGRTSSGHAYEDPGEDAGAAFVWAHGLTASRDHEDATNLFDWSRCRGVRVIRYDARGHGSSDPPSSIAAATWPALANDLLEVMDAVDIERCAIGGASMGCATALYASLLAPERVDRAVLAAAPTAWHTRVEQRALYESDAARLERDGLGSYLMQAATSPVPTVFHDISEQLRAASLAHLAAFDPVVLSLLLRGAAASDLPEPSTLQELHVPALLLAWPDDPSHPVSTAHHLAEVLPNASLHVASGVDEINSWPDIVNTFVVGHDT